MQVQTLSHEKLLTPAQLAERWAVQVNTLNAWRTRRQGPAFIKIGRKVLYKLTDVERFEAERRVETETSQ